MRTVVAALVVAAAAWLMLVVLAWALQRQLVYLPDRREPAPPVVADHLDVEEVTLVTGDDLTLTAWYVTPAVDVATTVLVTGGNAGNRGLRLPLAAGLAERGHAVLLLEYRGYGGNPGRPHEDGLVADARAARAWLGERADVDEARVAYLGESIGTGVAAALTAEQPPAALVLRSPFPSLPDVARTHYPFLPVRTLLRERFPIVDHLAGYDGPVLVVAGAADGTIPAALSREVADVTGADYVELPGADHNDPVFLDGARFLDAVDAFLRDVVDGAP